MSSLPAALASAISPILFCFIVNPPPPLLCVVVSSPSPSSGAILFLPLPDLPFFSLFFLFFLGFVDGLDGGWWWRFLGLGYLSGRFW
ncbi:hypothetical protein BVRB_1g011450 [Beta vulgaris subsp. vulgaris]|nr:hypothetical protein BVRB_1g011450 [Beta vulgaris subsp. vulgaris]